MTANVHTLGSSKCYFMKWGKQDPATMNKQVKTINPECQLSHNMQWPDSEFGTLLFSSLFHALGWQKLGCLTLYDTVHH